MKQTIVVTGLKSDIVKRDGKGDMTIATIDGHDIHGVPKVITLAYGKALQVSREIKGFLPEHDIANLKDVSIIITAEGKVHGEGDAETFRAQDFTLQSGHENELTRIHFEAAAIKREVDILMKAGEKEQASEKMIDFIEKHAKLPSIHSPENTSAPKTPIHDVSSLDDSIPEDESEPRPIRQRFNTKTEEQKVPEQPDVEAGDETVATPVSEKPKSRARQRFNAGGEEQKEPEQPEVDDEAVTTPETEKPKSRARQRFNAGGEEQKAPEQPDVEADTVTSETESVTTNKTTATASRVRKRFNTGDGEQKVPEQPDVEEKSVPSAKPASAPAMNASKRRSLGGASSPSSSSVGTSKSRMRPRFNTGGGEQASPVQPDVDEDVDTDSVTPPSVRPVPQTRSSATFTPSPTAIRPAQRPIPTTSPQRKVVIPRGTNAFNAVKPPQVSIPTAQPEKKVAEAPVNKFLSGFKSKRRTLG